jgi:hypothetical protein
MKITIATPMYGGAAQSEYVQCLQLLVDLLRQNDHEVQTVFTINESLITRARNSLVHEFLKTDHEALLFIDADHSYDPADILKMIDSGKDIIGAGYPMKAINWEAVRQAALLGKQNLQLYSGFFAMNFLPEASAVQNETPLAVRDVGTGMMFINRRVFDEMAPLCGKYVGNTVTAGSKGEMITEYFYTEIDPELNVLLSEDYAFCAKWRKMGNEVFVAPWVKITHIGHYVFGGSMMHSLMLQQEAAQLSEASQAASSETVAE